MHDRTQKQITQNWNIHSPPLVSVCCITYNHELYIQKALDSFLMQETNFPFEVIVHDDASTDGTSGIILEYAKKYPAIIRPIIQPENQYMKGGLIALRFTFPQAKGKYIALCEGDDYWTDCSKLQKQVQFLENNPEYVITYTDSQVLDETGYLIANSGGTTRDVSSEELKRCIPLYTLTTCFRNVIQKIPQDLMSARIGDQVTWSLLGSHGKGKFLSDILPAVYRVHDGGIFSKKSRRQRLEMRLITYNSLYAYYVRSDDIESARFFREYSFNTARKIIGWKRLATLMIQFLLGKVPDKNKFLMGNKKQDIINEQNN